MCPLNKKVCDAAEDPAPASHAVLPTPGWHLLTWELEALWPPMQHPNTSLYSLTGHFLVGKDAFSIDLTFHLLSTQPVKAVAGRQH